MNLFSRLFARVVSCVTAQESDNEEVETSQNPVNCDELNTQESEVKELAELRDFKLMILTGPRFVCQIYLYRNRDRIRYNFYKTGAFKHLTIGSSWSGTPNRIEQFPNSPFQDVFGSIIKGSRFRRLTIYNKNGPLELEFDKTLFEYVGESITLEKILVLLTKHLQDTPIPALGMLPLPGGDYALDRAHICSIPECISTTFPDEPQPPLRFAVHAWKSTSAPDEIDDWVSWFFLHRIAIYSDGYDLVLDFHKSDQTKLLERTLRAFAGDEVTSEVRASLAQLGDREFIVNSEQIEAWIGSLKEDEDSPLPMS